MVQPGRSTASALPQTKSMAAAIPLSAGITAAYRSSTPQPADEIAKAAFERAKQALRKELKGDKAGLHIVDSKVSIEDVRLAVGDIQRGYSDHGKKRKKVLEWLHSFSARIAHYERVLDTLAQHHPEYVSLAWGVLKIVFTGVINHHELVERLAQALTDIGEKLSHVQLTAELYQTERMKEAVAHLYAQILKFFVSAVSWYKHHSATRVLLSIVSPYDVAFKDDLNHVKTAADSIAALASLANQAELRDVNGTLQDVSDTIQDVNGIVWDTKYSVQDTNHTVQGISYNVQKVMSGVGSMDLRLSRVEDGVQEIGRHTLHYEKLIDRKIEIAMKAGWQRPPAAVRDVHCFQREILVQLKPSIDPEQSLHKQQVLFKKLQKKPGYVFAVGSVMAALNLWGRSPESSLLVLQAGPLANAATKGLAVELVSIIRNQGHKVFCTLSQPNFDNYTPSVENILKSLMYQAAHQHKDILHELPDGFNFDKLKSYHSEGEWLDLLSMILCKLERSVIVIESEDLYRLNCSNAAWPLQFLSRFRQLTESVEASGGMVKTLVLNFSARDPQVVAGLEDSPHVHATVQRAAPLPPRLKRIAAARSEKQRRSLNTLKLER